MKASEMRSKTRDELNQELESLLKEQFSLRMRHAGNELAQTSQMKTVRRAIARVKTILNEQKMSAE